MLTNIKIVNTKVTFNILEWVNNDQLVKKKLLKNLNLTSESVLYTEKTFYESPIMAQL